MAQVDAVRSDETKNALEQAAEQIKANEESKANREAVDAARAQMGAVLNGGLQLDQDKLEDDDDAEPKVEPMEAAFRRIQEEMKRRFSSRLNTDGQNDNIATLQQGKRIFETFELISGEEDEDGMLKKDGRPPFTIRFQSVNSDEESFISQVALRNGPALRSGTEIKPIYDETWRMEMMLVFSTVALGGKPIIPVGIEDMYSQPGSRSEENTTSVAEKVREVNNRLGEIRRQIPMGIYSIAITALGVWVKYQRDLVSPMRIANFSTPPSERS